MKTKIILLPICLLFVIAFGVKSQTIVIDTTQISFEDKLRPCLSSKVDPKPKDLEKNWSNYLKDKYEIKMKGGGFLSGKDVLIAEDVIIPSVSTNRMNIYTSVGKTATGSDMSLLGSFGYDFFIGLDNYPEEFRHLGEIMNKFLLEYLNDYYSEEIDFLTKDISSLAKEKIKILKLIVSSKKKIAKSKSEKKSINKSYDSPDEIPIKELEKLSKLTKQINSAENVISKSEHEVRSIDEKSIDENAKLEQIKIKRKRLIQ